MRVTTFVRAERAVYVLVDRKPVSEHSSREEAKREAARLAAWVDGPDSEAARAGRRENPGCHAWYACDDASVSVRLRGGLVRVATSLNPADLDPGQAGELARHLQACAAWLRAQKDGGR